MIRHPIRQPLKTLLALAVLLPLGCDTEDTDDAEGREAHVVALELSPSQDLVDDPDVSAFEGIDAIDDLEIETDTQFGAGCTLLRPAAWYGPGATCVEYFLPHGSPPGMLPMADGQTFLTDSTYLGTGTARITCTNGAIKIKALSCYEGSPF